MPVQSKGSLLAGRYRTIRPLGSGGMAVVFLCEDERLGRQVAVKRLHAHSPEDVARRFAREARVGASLNHPNLVSIYDTATDEDGVLIVMELIEGETLRDALQRGRLDPKRALAVLRDVASALDHAHRHGVVHRDVKPANVLLRADGVSKLVDMGIALAADSTRITRSGTLLGTAAYMAPEQLEGHKAGPAADVYALAAVAFEALSGRKAYTGETPIEIANKVATAPAPDLREALPEAPPGAVEALRRGMARDPHQRPLTAGALLEELEHAFARAPQPTATAPTRRALEQPRRRPPEPVFSGPPRRRSRLPALSALAAALVAGVVVVALALGGGDGDGGSGGGDKSAGKVPAREAPAKKPAPQQPARPPAASPGAQTGGQGGAAGGQALNDQGFALMGQGRYQQAIPLLERSVAAFPQDSQDTTYAYALYNLGASLRRAGRAGEAIPILERRLEIPNQTGVVKRELELARRDAGR